MDILGNHTFVKKLLIARPTKICSKLCQEDSLKGHSKQFPDFFTVRFRGQAVSMYKDNVYIHSCESWQVASRT